MEHINNEINVVSVEKRIRGRVKQQMEKSQREYYLNEQMKAIQKELGEIGDEPNDLDALQEALKHLALQEGRLLTYLYW